MNSVIEPLYKSPNKITFGWEQETGAYGYKIYVGLGPSTSFMNLLYDNISPQASHETPTVGKVPYIADIEDIRDILGLASTITFNNKLFYFTLTYVDSAGTESALADSTIIEVPPVGIIPKKMKDDPSINRHGYVFSDADLKWIKMAGTSSGGVIIDANDFYKANIVLEYTYDGTDLKTMKSYPSDATSAGSPAKLTTYTYTGGLLTKTEITDSTV